MKKIIALLLVFILALSGCSTAIEGAQGALDDLSDAVKDGTLSSMAEGFASTAGEFASGVGEALPEDVQSTVSEFLPESSSESAAPQTAGGPSEFFSPDGHPIGTGEKSASSFHPDFPLTVSIEKNSFQSEEPIAVTFSDETWYLGTDAWVGIIPASVPHGEEVVSDDYDLDYFHFSGYDGFSFEFSTSLDPGDYELRAFSSDNGGVELCFIPFTVA